MNSDLKQTPDEEMDVLREDEPYEIGFAEYYETNLRSLFEKHAKAAKTHLALSEVHANKERHRYRRGHWRFFPVAVTVWVFGLYGLSLIDWPHSFDHWALLCLMAFILTFVIFFWAYKDAMTSRKGTGDPFQGCSMEKDIFPRIVSFLGEFQCKFGRLLHHQMDRYEDFGIVPSYDKEKSANQIIGAYKGVEFDLFETTLTKKVLEIDHGRVRGQTYYVTQFRGLVISLSLNKTFEGKTVVKKDRGRLVNWTRDKLSDLEVVRLEDPRFEKEFEVYSTDQVEARYLLTGSFMERLVKVRYAFRVLNEYIEPAITCSFYKNQLLMMIPISESRNMFEKTGGSPMDQCKSLFKEMNTILQIIDILKLDSDIRL